jgi:hypothetical protein
MKVFPPRFVWTLSSVITLGQRWPVIRAFAHPSL